MPDTPALDRMRADWNRRADLNLHRFRRRLTNREVIFTPHVADNRFVNAQTADPTTFGANNVVHRQHRRLGNSTADVDDHVPGERANRQSCANGRR